ncbi:MAG: hypothetical protein GY757_38640 [bacterium]|nr:hypothetical protein [bacterium]
METKKLVLIVVSIFVLSIVFSNKLHAEYRLEFDSIECPEQIAIPHPIPESVGHSNIICKINYIYHGNLIADGKMNGHSGPTKIDRNCLIYARVIYLDKKNNALMVLTKPEDGESYYSNPYSNIIRVSGIKAIFMENEKYTTDFYFFSSHCLNKKKIDRLLKEKKIKKIAIEIDKIIVDWTYEYSARQDEKDKYGKWKRNSVIRKGKFDFKVGKKVSIKVNYENENK